MPYRTLPRARGRWGLDSGGFTELSIYGGWVTTCREYVENVRHYQSEIGSMDFAVIQDWMCEPIMMQITGLSILEHQERTIESYLNLMERDPEIPWMPVLQGWEQDDYQRHLEMYCDAGVDLSLLSVVGIGTVCRRQGTQEIDTIIRSVARHGIRLHGFGVKAGGLVLSASILESADSAAWSYQARIRKFKMSGCHHQAKTCNNCLRWALEWRRRLLRSLAGSSVRRVKV